MKLVSGRRGTPAAQTRRKAGQKGPGRPEGTSVVRDDILDAAEELFSNLGYAGTTLREIADQAKVTQALINYYFGSKYGLYEAVFMRRSQIISQQRLDNLAQLQAKPGRPKVRDVVQAFLMPTLAFRSTPEGRSFLRLQAPPQISYKLRTDAYGNSTRLYVDAVRKALPNLPELDAYWRVTLMVGTYLYAFSDTHRMEEMAPAGLYDPDDTDNLIDQVTRFVTGGMQAP